MEAAKGRSKQPSDIIFALDIGTRSVIGMIGKAQGDQIQVLDVEVIEHKKRVMIDGQIEDIQQVSLVAKQVKEALEERSNFILQRVSVAAAGRALHTIKISNELAIDTNGIIDVELIEKLESSTIELANEQMRKDQAKEAQVYCVGYSVMKYTLDGYPLSTLLAHRGHRIGVELLVTFLPNEVIESLYASMNAIQLEIESLTLEPIAAMNVVIPTDLRNLNLVLVDIGAGTSDIAISRNGSVIAYAMATIAGDELTEAICNAYLVDFATAEQMKHALSLTQVIQYQDILGNEYEIDHAELMDSVSSTLRLLCEELKTKIWETNGGSPAALFLVGGASKIPGITSMIGSLMQLDSRKIVVGGGMSVRKLIDSSLDVFQPEYVTPLGILLTTLQMKQKDGLAVFVNDKKSTLMIKRSTSVIDILLSSGYQYHQMIASSGKNLIYTLNHEDKIVRGQAATPAIVMLNQRPVSVFTSVKGGDAIHFIPSLAGKDAATTIRQVLPHSRRIQVYYHDETYQAGMFVKVNGDTASFDDEICEYDQIETVEIDTLGELLKHHQLSSENIWFYVNQEEVQLTYLLQDQDRIEGLIVQFKQPKQVEAMIEEELGVDLMGATVASKGLKVIINGKMQWLPSLDTGHPAVFLDALNGVDVDLKDVDGNIVYLLNGNNASFLEPLKENDEIEITWKRKKV